MTTSINKDHGNMCYLQSIYKHAQGLEKTLKDLQTAA